MRDKEVRGGSLCVSVMLIMLVLLVSSQPPRSARRGRPHSGTTTVPAAGLGLHLAVCSTTERLTAKSEDLEKT